MTHAEPNHWHDIETRISWSLLVCFFARCAIRVSAQTPAPTGKPKFEVASVRENTADDGKVMFGIQPGGRFMPSTCRSGI